MTESIDAFTLTDLQEAFVDAFTGEAEFDAIESCRIAGYKNSANPYSSAKRVLDSKAVRLAIHKRMSESNVWLNEGAVIDRLWKEGLTASNASSRVNALVWVGKHLGMWKDKQEDADAAITYNIVNYGTSKNEMVEKIESKPEVALSRDKAELPEGVVLINYKEAH